METARIGIIGGSGFYSMDNLKNTHWLNLTTPFGIPSDRIMIGELLGQRVAFLSRHGQGHILNPSEVNYRANLFALKMLGVEILISITAVGSLKEDLPPTSLVIPDQYVDLTYRRDKTFFEDGVVAHVSMADPTCVLLSNLCYQIATELGLSVTLGGVYINMEGPQFSSRGESLVYRQLGFSVIGMTQAIEAKLARELEFCFIPLAFVTDYDCWHQEVEAVSVEMVINYLNKNIANAKKIIALFCEKVPAETTCSCRNALQNAIITNPAMIPNKTFRKLELIIGKYIKNRI